VIAARVAGATVAHGTVRLSGALLEGNKEDLPVAVTPPILLRSGFIFHLVGAHTGELVELRRQKKPEWLAALDLSNQFFDCHPPFPVQWIIQHGALGTSVIPARIPPEGPVISGETASEKDELWRQVICSAAALEPGADAVKPVWLAYVKAAQAMVPERAL
jgi:hypothetical protein